MKENVHGGQKFSSKVKIAVGDTGSQNQKSKGQASRMTTYHNHRRNDDLRRITKNNFQASAMAVEHMWLCRHGCTCSTPHSLGPREVAASNQAQKKTLPTWKQQEAERKQNFDIRGDFRDQQRSERGIFEELIKAGKTIARYQGLKQGAGMDQPKKGKKKKGKRSEIHANSKFIGPTMVEGRPGNGYTNLSPDRRFSVSLLGRRMKRGEFIWTMGQIFLPVKIGDAEHSTSTWMNFVVWVTWMGIPHSAEASRIIPLECTMVSGPEAQTSNRKDERHCARCNLDIFAWKQADMTGVSRHIAKHRLNVREGCSLIRQKKRGQAPERNKAIQ
ncbi:hypothetical protein Tco_0474690 [Tanacetum coccineum]